MIFLKNIPKNSLKVLVLLTTVFLFSSCDSDEKHPETAGGSELTPTSMVTDDSEPEVSLLAACARCHGRDGVTSKSDTPFIAGLSAEYLEVSMRSYLAEERKHDVMRQSMLGLDVSQRHELANYYSNLKTAWKGGAELRALNLGKQQVRVTRKNVREGKAISTPCEGCHGIDGNSVKAGVPSLAGLQPAYFVPALKYYLSGVRRGAAIMKNFKLALDEKDINNLAAYYSVQQRIKSPLSDKLLKTIPSDALVPRCEGCHGVNGNSTHPAMPSLSGQNASYLIKAMKRYRDGERPNQMMADIAKGLSDEDIAKNSAFFAKQTPESYSRKKALNANSTVFDPLDDGRQLAASCNACHGKEGNSVNSGVPRLAGLSANYLQLSIQAYRDGKRKHREMKMLTEYLSDTEIEKISYYYASQRPKQASATLNGANAKAGLRISGSCASCHNKDGNSKKPLIPSIAGQDVKYLADAMMAYKDNGGRDNGDMVNALKELEEQAIKNLALYYAQLAPAASTPRVLEAPDVLSKKCNRCHGSDGKDPDVEKPRIAGQRESYLVSALLAYKNEQRANSMMQAMSKELWLVEIEAIAAYYSRK